MHTSNTIHECLTLINMMQNHVKSMFNHHEFDLEYTQNCSATTATFCALSFKGPIIAAEQTQRHGSDQY